MGEMSKLVIPIGCSIREMRADSLYFLYVVFVSICKICTVSAHMPLLDHPISQHSLDISPIWTPVITTEVKNVQRRPM
jgi:hypothetical protein